MHPFAALFRHRWLGCHAPKSLCVACCGVRLGGELHGSSAASIHAAVPTTTTVITTHIMDHVIAILFSWFEIEYYSAVIHVLVVASISSITDQPHR